MLSFLLPLFFLLLLPLFRQMLLKLRLEIHDLILKLLLLFLLLLHCQILIGSKILNLTLHLFYLTLKSFRHRISHR